jgi:hypothetical protein
MMWKLRMVLCALVGIATLGICQPLAPENDIVFSSSKTPSTPLPMSFSGASGWQIPNVAIPTKAHNTELFIMLILDKRPYMMDVHPIGMKSYILSFHIITIKTKTGYILPR